MNNRLELMKNLYKILFIRKLSNLLLEQIYNKCSDNLEKGKIECGKKIIISVIKKIRASK